ncbi:MAG: MFS transporter, partial [Acidimicrobiales bacterium]
VGETLFDTAAQSVMPMVVGSGDLSKANGRLYAIETIMNNFVGAPLGGLLFAAAVALPFAGSAGCYLVAAGCLALMVGRYRPERDGEVPAPMRTDIAEGLRFLWNHRLLRTLAFMVGVMNLATSATFAIFPLFAVDPGPMGLSEQGYGLFLISFAVGSLIGSSLAPWMERRFGRSRSLAMAVVGNGVVCAAPLVPGVGGAAAAIVAGGVMVMVWNIITVSLRQRITPEHLMGRVNAGYRLLAWGTLPIGAALGGFLAEALSLRWVFGLAGAGSLLLLGCMSVVTDATMEKAESAVEPPAYHSSVEPPPPDSPPPPS